MLNAVAPSPSLTIGGLVLTDLENLITLVGATAAAGANTVLSFRLPNGTAGYTVPANKKFVAKAVKIWTRDATVMFPILFYCDNDLGMGSTTAPTNPVYMGGSSNATFTTVLTVGGNIELSQLNFEIPVGKYISLSDGAAGAGLSCLLYGYLQDV